MLKKISCVTAALATLAACGGSGGGGPVVTPKFSPTSGFEGSENASVQLNGDGTKIIVDANGTTTALDVGSAATVGSFDGGYEESGAEYTLAYVSESATSRASVLAYRAGGGPSTSAHFRRTQTIDAPTSGTAITTGDYVGVLSANGSPVATVTGDARMVANFGAGTIRGRVTNRQLTSPVTGNPAGVGSMANISLEETTLTANGRFDGTASGGEYTGGGSTAVNTSASYSGLVAGTNGSEVVGAVSIDSTISGTALNETGAFATGH